LYRRFFEDSLILSQVKADMLRFESAKDRYSRLIQLFPEIVKRAPLTYIASYLQMSLETLSRARSSMI
ncbi:MAG: Crp/Fnr family transcriptional regulator, partial [Bacteroidaceae bacterium]|nr:Crp/Fnr family transcriptional regulator [Bacteroidaceae bacterium]